MNPILRAGDLVLVERWRGNLQATQIEFVLGWIEHIKRQADEYGNSTTIYKIHWSDKYTDKTKYYRKSDVIIWRNIYLRERKKLGL